jgi:hypothetical protein
MPMSTTDQDLWGLTYGKRWIDANAMAIALETQALQPDLDFRTRLLIRDGLNALQRHWGDSRFQSWLNSSAARENLAEIWQSDLGAAGFHFLEERLMQPLEPQTILDFLRELGENLDRPTTINVGGSIALMLQNVLRRGTEDIDVVDEVPIEIRAQHELLHRLAKRFGLQVTHFQSHYLPSGWNGRLHSLGVFGRLTVHLVDVYDIFVGKLFSKREKDSDDLRILRGQLDRARIETRLRDSAGLLMAEPELAKDAARSWHILYGDALPS